MANTFIAYFIWLFLGWAGIHHIYLGRLEQAILYGQTLGFFGVGYLADLFLIPYYVMCANTQLSSSTSPPPLVSKSTSGGGCSSALSNFLLGNFRVVLTTAIAYIYAWMMESVWIYAGDASADGVYEDSSNIEDIYLRAGAYIFMALAATTGAYLVIHMGHNSVTSKRYMFFGSLAFMVFAGYYSPDTEGIPLKYSAALGAALVGNLITKNVGTAKATIGVPGGGSNASNTTTTNKKVHANGEKIGETVCCCCTRVAHSDKPLANTTAASPSSSSSSFCGCFSSIIKVGISIILFWAWLLFLLIAHQDIPIDAQGKFSPHAGIHTAKVGPWAYEHPEETYKYISTLWIEVNRYRQSTSWDGFKRGVYQFVDDEDEYATLGLRKGRATVEDVRRAYKEKARVLHPDRLPSDASSETISAATEKFRKVEAAYRTLCSSLGGSSGCRKHSGGRRGGAGAGKGGSRSGRGSGNDDIDDDDDDYNGQQSGGRAGRKGTGSSSGSGSGSKSRGKWGRQLDEDDL